MNIITKKRSLLKMRLIMFASIMLVAGFCLLFTASNSLAATYTLDISSPVANTTYLADFTAEGFDPSTEEVISGYLYLMVRSSSSSSDTSFTLELENNERDQSWVTTWERLSITMEDFTLIDEDGTIEYILKTYMGGGYTGAGAFTIETTAIGPEITVTDNADASDDLSVSFGDVTLSTTSTRTVTITNDGNEDLVLGSIALADPLAAPFSWVDNCDVQTLPAGASCSFNVSFSPTTAGPFSDSFDIPSNDSNENPVTVNVSGTGMAATAPEIDVTDSIAPVDNHDMDFGNITEGTSSAAETVTISNTGNAPLNVSNIQLTGTDTGEFSLDVNGGSSPCVTATPTVAAADSCTVTVAFSPSSEGAKTANLMITSNDADEATINVALSGTGIAALVPDINVMDSIVDINDNDMPFPDTTEGTSSAIETVTISNTGTDSLIVSNIQLTGADTGEFSLDVNGGSDPCVTATPTVAAAGSCTVTVTFSPTAQDAYTANLEITSNDPDPAEATINVALSGTGLQAVVNNNPNPFDLVSPADGQVDVSYPTTFTWEPSTDPDGDPVTYDFYNCEDPDPFACDPVEVASLTNDTAEKIYYAGFGYGTGIMLFGIVLAGAIFGRKKAALWRIIGIIVISSAILPSCGVFDTHQSNPAPTVSAEDNNISFTVPSGQTSGMTYHWTVVAKDDKGGETQSDTWIYTTE